MMVAAIVPTMNEADTIGPLVADLSCVCDRVVVADDSTDFTPWLAEDAGATVLNATGGLDAAYLFGNAEIDPDWWTVHVDAGGSHSPEDVTRLIDHAAKLEPDITIGSRFCPGAHYEGRPFRRLGSRVAAMAMNQSYIRLCRRVTDLHEQDFYDWTSGLRVYSPAARVAVREHQFRSSGHAWQIEALWVALCGGCRIAEIPITYRAGTSHMSPSRAWEAWQLWLSMS